MVEEVKLEFRLVCDWRPGAVKIVVFARSLFGLAHRGFASRVVAALGLAQQRSDLTRIRYLEVGMPAIEESCLTQPRK